MKLRTVVAFAVGYVLGARAGRDRYEQMRRAYRRATSHERVRNVIDQGKEVLDAGTAQMRGAVADQLAHAGDAIRERVDGNGHPD